jgi:hypothetical protein
MSLIGTLRPSDGRALAVLALAAGLTITGCESDSPDIDATQSSVATAGVELVAASGGGGGAADRQAPSAPSSLRTSNPTSMSVTLTWNPATDDVGVVAYDLYNTSTLMGSTKGTSVTVFNLTTGATYSFRVRARDAAGNTSSESNVVTVVPGSGGGGGSTGGGGGGGAIGGGGGHVGGGGGGGVVVGGGGGSTTGACTATFSATSWTGGFTGTVTVKANSTPVNGWTVTLNLGKNTVTQVWSATQSGSTFKNLSYNGTLGSGGSTSFGLNGSFSGSFTPPTVTSCTSP